MNDALINGLFGLGGAICSIIAARSSASIEKLKTDKTLLQDQVARLLRQVESYHLLEDLYAQHLARELGDVAPRSLKTKLRDEVVKLHQCDRPEMTANDARKRLQDVAW